MKQVNNDVKHTNEKNIPKRRLKFRRPTLRDIIFVIVGVLFAFLLRLTFVDSNVVHYHANFALFVNGRRDDFSNFTFYEEIASCSNSDVFNPKTRVHMHNQQNDIIHVHDVGATWSAFFANIGYTLSDKLLATPDGIFTSTPDGKKMNFILNGKEITNVANKTIESEDTLLIDYGNDSEAALKTRYDAINKTSHEYNLKPDPQSCSGGENESFMQRVKRTIGISESGHPAEQSHSH